MAVAQDSGGMYLVAEYMGFTQEPGHSAYEFPYIKFYAF